MIEKEKRKPIGKGETSENERESAKAVTLLLRERNQQKQLPYHLSVGRSRGQQQEWATAATVAGFLFRNSSSRLFPKIIDCSNVWDRAEGEANNFGLATSSLVWAA